MRITDNHRASQLSRNVQTSLENLNTIQQQISTGKKLNTLSDDPAAAAQALALRTSLVNNGQYQRDANAATQFLTASESALSDANSLLLQARQIAVQGATSTQSAASETALAAQVDGIINQLTRIANADVHGKYLFSGTQTQTPPFLASDPTHAYQGDSGTVVSTIGPSDSVALNSSGAAAFSSAFSVLESLKANLTSSNYTAVSANLDGLDAATTTVSSVRAGVGARINSVDAIKQRLTRAQGDTEEALSNVEDVDLATAYVQLQSAQNVYQASLVTTSNAFKHSLADYL